ncbi:MAG: sugar phosphate isomerase/epimerase [Armatimonadetes bacterium]|nr:sugar phosphate isomerase/epimerase [Armatimonadota bacterium]
MRLSLSGRIIEVEYRSTEMTVPDFLRMAARNGYEAVELRATQLPEGTTPDEASRFLQEAGALGLAVSCCAPPGLTGDGAGLARLAKFAPLARILKCNTLKIWVNDIAWIQAACDLAQPLGLSLIAQTHTDGPFETVETALASLRRIARPNFGLQYDAANFYEKEEPYGELAVKALGGYIRQLSVQNLRLARPGEADSWEYAGRRYVRALPGEAEGIDFPSVFRGLKAIGFDGFATLNEPRPARVETEEFIRKVRDEIDRLR